MEKKKFLRVSFPGFARFANLPDWVGSLYFFSPYEQDSYKYQTSYNITVLFLDSSNPARKRVHSRFIVKILVKSYIRVFFYNNTCNHKGNVRHPRTALQATKCVLPSIKVTHRARSTPPPCVWTTHYTTDTTPMHTQPPRLSTLNPIISSSFVWHPTNALQDQSIE